MSGLPVILICEYIFTRKTPARVVIVVPEIPVILICEYIFTRKPPARVVIVVPEIPRK